MRAEPDLGAIVRSCGETYCQTHSLTAVQRKALRAIRDCRTPALGGHRDQCDHCGYEHVHWHSCRNRHCPQCQGAARVQWLEARGDELLPVPYFHVVFTLPRELNPIALRAPRLFYPLLLRAAGQTLLDVGKSKLRVQLGALCVLHTWGQTLAFHPHVHCVVAGGGFSIDSPQWRAVRKPTFFLPVRVLSRRFRTLMCTALRDAIAAQKLPPLELDLPHLLRQVGGREWVVYSKPPFGGPAQVLKYLASYTHRIAISNRRIVSFDGQRVTFRYRDYAAGNAQKLMTLDAHEFLRRFLLHVVPTRLVRIRYYGFLANRVRHANVARARELLGSRAPDHGPVATPGSTPCPRCHRGAMHIIARIEPVHRSPRFEDSS